MISSVVEELRSGFEAELYLVLEKLKVSEDATVRSSILSILFQLDPDNAEVCVRERECVCVRERVECV